MKVKYYDTVREPKGWKEISLSISKSLQLLIKGFVKIDKFMKEGWTADFQMYIVHCSKCNKHYYSRTYGYSEHFDDCSVCAYGWKEDL